MDGLVIKSTGSWYEVLVDSGQKVHCRIKGKLRLSNIKTTNPIAVGDRVHIEFEADQDTGIIQRIYSRKNYIIRQSINLARQSQIIAANLDQAFLIITLVSPSTSLGFIDRFLVTAEAYHIPASLIFNKLDLYHPKEIAALANYQAIYENIGYPCFSISAIQQADLDPIKDLLKDQVTLIAGHSGVGKSTLINGLIPGADARTGAISAWSDQGKHTTTFAEMIALPAGGYLIDTPGIRELGIVDIDRQELGYLFPEIRQHSKGCQFHNCEHRHEPACDVLKAVEAHAIAPSRYESYLSIYYRKERANHLS